MAAGSENDNAAGFKEEVRKVTGTLSAKVQGETSSKGEHPEEEMQIERSATSPEFLLWSPLELPSIHLWAELDRKRGCSYYI